jgi:cell volume regulation protein A
MPVNLVVDGVTKSADADSENIWQQTVAEYINANLESAPVAGDTVAINDEWLLVIKDIDGKGVLRTIGLKQQKKAS